MAKLTWNPDNLPIRPGVYVNFTNEAIRAVLGGTRGIVAIPLVNYGVDAEEGKFYTVESEKQADELFGVDNTRSIKLALKGGASKVLAYTLPTPIGEENVYTEYLDLLETQKFNVLVLDAVDDEAVQTEVTEWVTKVRDDEDIQKHVLAVFGGSAADDLDSTIGNARSVALADDYVVNLISGAVIGAETLSSAEYAPYIAGLIAGTAINKSVTYVSAGVDDVPKRLKGGEIREALEAGSFVFFHDGDKVKVEQGITTSKEPIRSIVTRQAILNDVPNFLRNEAIARLDNTPDGWASVIAMIMKLLDEGFESIGAITDVHVYLDTENQAEGNAAFFVIEYTDIHTMERIFLNVRRQG